MILYHRLIQKIEVRLNARITAKRLTTGTVQRELLKRLLNHLQRMTQLNSEEGDPFWLTTLPILSCGFHLNNRAFIDALCLRYSWRVDDMALVCPCGQKNSINHVLICPKEAS